MWVRLTGAHGLINSANITDMSTLRNISIFIWKIRKGVINQISQLLLCHSLIFFIPSTIVGFSVQSDLLFGANSIRCLCRSHWAHSYVDIHYLWWAESIGANRHMQREAATLLDRLKKNRINNRIPLIILLQQCRFIC